MQIQLDASENRVSGAIRWVCVYDASASIQMKWERCIARCHCINFCTYVVSFCLIKSQIKRIDGQSGSKRKCEHATSVHRRVKEEKMMIVIIMKNERNQNKCTHAHTHIKGQSALIHSISWLLFFIQRCTENIAPISLCFLLSFDFFLSPFHCLDLSLRFFFSLSRSTIRFSDSYKIQLSAVPKPITKTLKKYMYVYSMS